jgi:hypothetical protein
MRAPGLRGFLKRLRMAEARIKETRPAAYREAMVPLERARAVLLKLGKEGAWIEHLAGIRERHRRKRRLMAMLDSLEGRPRLRGRLEAPRPGLKAGEPPGDGQGVG